ncbi:MAG: EscU/YscU/HrcU family type III secretion system export apparatus switch protein [Aquabacterium sp.]
MSEGDLDKSDPASPYKLEKAREKGSVAKSQDLSFLVMLFGLTCMVFGMGDSLVRDLSAVLHAALAQTFRAEWDAAQYLALFGKLARDIIVVLAAPLGAVMILAIGAGVWQVGFTVSTEPLKPDFSRINPANGFKKLFSMRSIYELGRSSIKLGLVALLILAAGQSILGEVSVLSLREPAGILAYLVHKTGVILAMLTALLALVGVADMAYTKWEFLKKMRMSKREVKDEHKQREGDPRIKSRLRELRLEWLKKAMAARRVPQADVLVTNPTHFAVAIAYQRDTMAAPRILAKGAGDLALRMREIARQHRVPIVENPPLARALYRSAEPDDFLPEAHYSEVARILVWVFAARNRRTPASAGSVVKPSSST